MTFLCTKIAFWLLPFSNCALYFFYWFDVSDVPQNHNAFNPLNSISFTWKIDESCVFSLRERESSSRMWPFFPILLQWDNLHITQKRHRLLVVIMREACTTWSHRPSPIHNDNINFFVVHWLSTGTAMRAEGVNQTTSIYIHVYRTYQFAICLYTHQPMIGKKESEVKPRTNDDQEEIDVPTDKKIICVRQRNIISITPLTRARLLSESDFSISKLSLATEIGCSVTGFCVVRLSPYSIQWKM